MRPLASIYSHRVPEFMEIQVGFNSIQKRNSNPKRKVQPRLSTGTVDRAYPRAEPLQSVDRGQSTAPSCARPCTPVDRAGRPASSTGRPGGRPGAQFACSMRRSSFFCRPISVLSSSISSISSIFSLPTILHLGEDFSNLSRSPTYPNLSPGEIDTRSRRNRHTISAWNLYLSYPLECTTHAFPILHLWRTSIHAEHRAWLLLRNFTTSRRLSHEPTLTLQPTSFI